MKTNINFTKTISIKNGRQFVVRCFLLAVCSSISLVSLAGCGNSDPYAVVPVSGTLTFEGQPVSGIRMNFAPVEGRPSIAITDAEGKFKPLYRVGQYGVQKGTLNVTLERNDDGSEILGGGASPGKDTAKLLELYGHGGTAIEVEIKAATQDLKIDLTNDG